MTKAYANKLKAHFLSNRLYYILALISVFCGILIGAFASTKADSGTKYLDNLFSAWSLQGISYFEVFIKSLISNLRYIILLWFSGWFIWLIPINLITLASKGFGVGYTISFMVGSGGFKGFLFAFVSLFFQNIILLPAMVIYAVIQLRFTAELDKLKNSSARYRQRKQLIIKNTVVLAVFLFVSALCSGIETYVVPFFIKIIC